MNLSIKIFIALIASVVVGLIAGAENLPFIKWWIAPIGTIFINLIKMMIVPVVFTSLVVGMTSLGDTRTLGRIGMKTVAIYLVTTAIAIVIGFAVALIGHPGAGMVITGDATVTVKEAPSIMQVFVSMIPTNPVDSMAKAQILPVIVFALFIGGTVYPLATLPLVLRRLHTLGRAKWEAGIVYAALLPNVIATAHTAHIFGRLALLGGDEPGDIIIDEILTISTAGDTAFIALWMLCAVLSLVGVVRLLRA